MKAILDILHKWCNWNSRRYRKFSFIRNHAFTLEFISGNVTVAMRPNHGRAFSREYVYTGSGEVQTETIGASNLLRSTYIKTSGVTYLKADGEVLIDER